MACQNPLVVFKHPVSICEVEKPICNTVNNSGIDHSLIILLPAGLFGAIFQRESIIKGSKKPKYS